MDRKIIAHCRNNRRGHQRPEHAQQASRATSGCDQATRGRNRAHEEVQFLVRDLQKNDITLESSMKGCISSLAKPSPARFRPSLTTARGWLSPREPMQRRRPPQDHCVRPRGSDHRFGARPAIGNGGGSCAAACLELVRGRAPCWLVISHPAAHSSQEQAGCKDVGWYLSTP